MGASPRDSLPGEQEVFTFCHSDRVIDGVVVADDPNVRDFLDEGRSACEIASLASECIDREPSPMPDSEKVSPGILRTDSLFKDSRSAPRESFGLCTSDAVIDCVVLSDGRSVRDFLGEGRPAVEIARLAGEGIAREGSRCLESPFEGEEGEVLCRELIPCVTIESLLRISAQWYIRNTFLYRRVNQFLRSSSNADRETGCNLGLYIGLV
jgi:hypothetical protein